MFHTVQEKSFILYVVMSILNYYLSFKAIAAFKHTCDKFEKVEQENSQLQDESRRLNKTLENLRNTCVKVCFGNCIA